MAVFDLEQQKIYVRIVYDGAATAGKTTNLRQLCSLFSTARRSELYTPAEIDGRTVLFDWMQITTGLACGFPLVCQVVAVPGQVVLEPRRTHLLRTADAVVYVSSSSRRALARSRQALAPLDRELASRAHPPPLVLQANKQDLSDAVGPAQVRAALGFQESTPIAAARAIEGVGVMETFVLTLRAIANHLQERANRDGMSVAVMPAETPEEVEAYLAAEDLPAGWETTLQEESDRDRREDAEQSVVDTHARAPEITSSTPSAEATPSADVSPSTDTAAVARSGETAAPSAETAAPSAETAASPSANGTEAPSKSVAPPAPTTEDILNRVGGPSLPSPNVPTGFIWPANFGRDVIRSLSYSTLVHRPDLANQTGLADGSDKNDVIICRVGDHCLKTSARRRYAEVESARAAFVRAARSKIHLGELVLPETVLVLQPDERAAHWLWTVTPWVTTLRTAMANAVARRDDDMLAAPLTAFANASVGAALLAARQNVLLDVHPSNYGVSNGKVYYLDDDVETGSELPTIGLAWLSRVDEYADHATAVDSYLRVLENAITERITGSDARKLKLENAVSEAIVRTPAGVAARARLTELLARLGTSS